MGRGDAERGQTSHAANATPQPTPTAIVIRVVLAVIGGYAASAGFVAILSVILPLAGVARSEAVILSSMLGFVLYVVFLLWGFAERRLWRLCLVLALAAGSGLAALNAAGG
jgi:hypothetical protein